MANTRFTPDGKFDSSDAAYWFLSDQYSLRRPVRLDLQHPSGLTVIMDAPTYLFRGEAGDYSTTLSSVERLNTYALKDGRQLSNADRDSLRTIWPGVLKCFNAPPYSLDTRASLCLLQHYFPVTWIVDFTRRLDHAFSFAAGGESSEPWKRIAVLPMQSFSGEVMDMSGNALIVRARRQEAFGVVPQPITDLKSDRARQLYGIRWYEFRVTDSERVEWKQKLDKLLRADDDPTAGNLRYEIERYIQENRVPPLIAEWLLEKAPLCAAVPPILSMTAAPQPGCASP
jgi:hypothetical protein